MTDHITLRAETVRLLSPACKAEIAAHLGFDMRPSAEQALLDEGDAEYAELGIQAARAFILGCGTKTLEALQAIIAAGDQFSISGLAAALGVEASSLRGVWTGLTKRVRTITGDGEAQLIEWTASGDEGDYIGRLMPVTREAFRRALAE